MEKAVGKDAPVKIINVKPLNMILIKTRRTGAESINLFGDWLYLFFGKRGI